MATGSFIPELNDPVKEGRLTTNDDYEIHHSQKTQQDVVVRFPEFFGAYEGKDEQTVEDTATANPSTVDDD